jgi:hypothetical protein
MWVPAARLDSGRLTRRLICCLLGLALGKNVAASVKSSRLKSCRAQTIASTTPIRPCFRFLLESLDGLLDHRCRDNGAAHMDAYLCGSVTLQTAPCRDHGRGTLKGISPAQMKLWTQGPRCSRVGAWGMRRHCGNVSNVQLASWGRMRKQSPSPLCGPVPVNLRCCHFGWSRNNATSC